MNLIISELYVAHMELKVWPLLTALKTKHLAFIEAQHRPSEIQTFCRPLLMLLILKNSQKIHRPFIPYHQTNRPPLVLAEILHLLEPWKARLFRILYHQTNRPPLVMAEILQQLEPWKARLFRIPHHQTNTPPLVLAEILQLEPWRTRLFSIPYHQTNRPFLILAEILHQLEPWKARLFRR